MLGSTVLELAIGLCVFYIAMSLVCSGVTQYLSEWRRWRGQILVGILGELVNHDAQEGDSVLAAILADARIAGGPPEAKPKADTAPDKKGLVLPAGGRIGKFAFTDALLDLVAGRMIQKTGTAAPPLAAGTDAGQAPTDPTGQLVQRLQRAIEILEASLAASLSGPELERWDARLNDLKTRIDALKGLPLDDVNRQAEDILQILKTTATAEGRAEIRVRLLGEVARETEDVLGLARKLTTARALALFAQGLPESPFRSFLSRLANRGALEPDEVKKAIQDWYASVNDRVSAEYRGKAKLVLFLVALGVTALLNADTFQVANRLIKDEALRKVVTQDAIAMASGSDGAPAGNAPTVAPVPSPPARTPATPAEVAPRAPDQGSGHGSLSRLDLPLRWTAKDWETLKGIGDTSQPGRMFDGLYKILGLLITSLALTMGAEFWYNLLKQLVPAVPGRKEDEAGRT
jgi:hypothetical protein